MGLESKTKQVKKKVVSRIDERDSTCKEMSIHKTIMYQGYYKR